MTATPFIGCVAAGLAVLAVGAVAFVLRRRPAGTVTMEWTALDLQCPYCKRWANIRLPQSVAAIETQMLAFQLIHQVCRK